MLSAMDVPLKRLSAALFIARRPVAERRMRPGVVIGNPSGDDLPSLIEIEKQAFVEKLVAHPAIEGFDVAVLPSAM